ncbi:ABC transporter substrate-binding protein [Paenibacillus aquistagni]|uniref:ABC transporter substrate-binding protein n=1 Tax=Paenibacillus aquistagni TaxID=1852522 RepID=UPI00145A678E|nr:ABC transporter substrate-binding protein [Paenibacillus aquistagni]NMM52712.1 ABC transporter substrate-binding protein [Paenibacillus aquistagni]
MVQSMNKPLRMMACMFVVVMLVIAGCGNPNTSSKAESSEHTVINASGAKESDKEAGTRKVKTAMGKVEVPVHPERVIVNWYVGDVFTLGIKPVAINAYAQETMPFYDKFEGIPILEKWESEEILSYNPDLIITYDPKDYESFSKLAPVLVVPEENVSSTERLLFLGEATGHESEAKQAIAAFEEKLMKAKEKLTDGIFKEKTFSILEDWGRESYGVMYETGSRGGTLLYDYIGLHMPKKLEDLVKESGNGRNSLSYEVASEYFGDYVLWFLKADYQSEYAKSVVWETIPAVKNGNIIQIPAKYAGLFYYSDVASMTAQLDYVVDQLVMLEK